MNQTDQQVLDEQAYLLEKDYKFQLERLQKAHQEEIDKLRTIEDEYRNDNFLKAQRNMDIRNQFEKWYSDLIRDMNQKQLNKQADTEEYEKIDKITNQIRDVQSTLQKQIKAKYVEENPILKELERELEFLEKENEDLVNRGAKIEQQIYNRGHYYVENPFSEEGKSVFADRGTHHDYQFYSQKWNLHGITVIDANQTANQSALERARRIIATDFNANKQNQSNNYNQFQAPLQQQQQIQPIQQQFVKQQPQQYVQYQQPQFIQQQQLPQQQFAQQPQQQQQMFNQSQPNFFTQQQLNSTFQSTAGQSFYKPQEQVKPKYM